MYYAFLFLYTVHSVDGVILWTEIAEIVAPDTQIIISPVTIGFFFDLVYQMSLECDFQKIIIHCTVTIHVYDDDLFDI